jgi:hypothetical protein
MEATMNPKDRHLAMTISDLITENWDVLEQANIAAEKATGKRMEELEEGSTEQELYHTIYLQELTRLTLLAVSSWFNPEKVVIG